MNYKSRKLALSSSLKLKSPAIRFAHLLSARIDWLFRTAALLIVTHKHADPNKYVDSNEMEIGLTYNKFSHSRPTHFKAAQLLFTATTALSQKERTLPKSAVNYLLEAALKFRDEAVEDDCSVTFVDDSASVLPRLP